MTMDLIVDDFADMGFGVRGALLRTEDGRIHGFEYEHPSPDGRTCKGYAPVWAEMQPNWDLLSEEPLTLSPSLLCRRCGHHGFVREGRWVEA